MNGRELDHRGRKPPKDFTRWVILAGVWLLYTTIWVSVASLAPLVSAIEADLGISHAAMGAVLGAWQFVYIGAAIPCGLLLDRIGTRHAFTLGALLMAGSALGRSFAEDHTQLLLTVGLFGLGGPIISAGAPKIVAEWFEGRPDLRADWRVGSVCWVGVGRVFCCFPSLSPVFLLQQRSMTAAGWGREPRR